MRHSFRLTLACVGAAGALAVGPALAASASTTAQSARHVDISSVRGGVEVSMSATRGSSLISQTFGAVPHARTPGSVIPDWSTVGFVNDVRVGKNNCAGFNGDVQWGGTSSTANYMIVYGTLWNNCNAYTPSTVYLYFGWTNLGSPHNDNIATVHSSSVGVNTDNSSYWYARYHDLQDAKPTSVDACLLWNNGWGCGPAHYF